MNRDQAIARADMFRIGSTTIDLSSREVKDHKVATYKGYSIASIGAAKRYTRASKGVRVVAQQRGENLRKVAERRWKEQDAERHAAIRAAAAAAREADQQAKQPAAT